jgi:hypothetical protein
MAGVTISEVSRDDLLAKIHVLIKEELAPVNARLEHIQKQLDNLSRQYHSLA